MRADHMAALSQRPDLVLVEEGGLADVIRRDQEVAAPSVPIQDPGDRGVRTDSSVIERQHQRSHAVRRSDRLEDRHRFRRDDSPESGDVLAEVVVLQLVSCRLEAGKSARVGLASRHDVVVEKRHRSRRLRLPLSAPGPVFPAQVAREPWLAPRRRGPSGRVERNRGSSLDLEQLLLDPVEIVEECAVLDPDVRLRPLVIATAKVDGPFNQIFALQDQVVRAVAHFIEAAAVIAIDGAGIDTLVDLQQCHADSLRIVVRQCPEASVRVSILGADSRVHHERAFGGNREYPFVQQGLAARNHHVGGDVSDERLRFGRIGAGGVEDGDRLHADAGIPSPELSELLSLPTAVAPREKQRVVGPARQHVQEPNHPDAPQFRSDALPRSPAGFAQNDQTAQRRERREPSPQAFLVQHGTVVTDEESFHVRSRLSTSVDMYSTRECHVSPPIASIRRRAAISPVSWTASSTWSTNSSAVAPIRTSPS